MNRFRAVPIAMALLLSVLAPAIVADDADEDRKRLVTPLKKKGAVLQWFPGGDLFPPALADPHRATFAFQPTATGLAWLPR